MIDPRVKTARSAGAVGRNAIVPRVAIEIGKPIKASLPSFALAGRGERMWFGMLDFGCGPSFHHHDQYASVALNVYGYDLAFNHKHAHLPEGPAIKWSTVKLYARQYGFNLVLASNVINVQSTEEELWDTCQQLREAAGWGVLGISTRCNHQCDILLNYPQDPRKLGWSMKKMSGYLIETGLGVQPDIVGPGVMLFRAPERMKQ